MGEGKFPSISSFLSKTKQIERTTAETALEAGTKAEVQRILNESAVHLTVINQKSVAATGEARADTAEFIQKSIQEAVEANSCRVKSILDEVFSKSSVDKEREEYWINKLCALFNIDKSIPMEDRFALIEKQMAEDPDTLNYVTYLVESGERNKPKS